MSVWSLLRKRDLELCTLSLVAILVSLEVLRHWKYPDEFRYMLIITYIVLGPCGCALIWSQLKNERVFAYFCWWSIGFVFILA